MRYHFGPHLECKSPSQLFELLMEYQLVQRSWDPDALTFSRTTFSSVRWVPGNIWYFRYWRGTGSFDYKLYNFILSIPKAMLRMDRKIPYKQKLEKVEEVIMEVVSSKLKLFSKSLLCNNIVIFFYPALAFTWKMQKYGYWHPRPSEGFIRWRKKTPRLRIRSPYRPSDAPMRRAHFWIGFFHGAQCLASPQTSCTKG